MPIENACWTSYWIGIIVFVQSVTVRKMYAVSTHQCFLSFGDNIFGNFVGVVALVTEVSAMRSLVIDPVDVPMYFAVWRRVLLSCFKI